MERYRGLLERYVELYNAGELDGVMDMYAEDSVQLMPDGTFEGRSAIRDRLATELAAVLGYRPSLRQLRRAPPSTLIQPRTRLLMHEGLRNGPHHSAAAPA
jgi:hypothetical protein